MKLGENIRAARKNISQSELAEKLAISSNTLSAYENNRNWPSIEIFKEICEVLNLSADELFGLNDVSNTPSNKGLMLNQKLVNIREQMQCTQEQMATMIQTSKSTWSKYEAGNRTPPLNRIKEICKVCKVSADYLIGTNKD